MSRFLTAAAAALLLSAAASAAPITITDTKPQFTSGFTLNTPAGSQGPITVAGNPWDYTAQPYLSLTSITNLSIALTLSDGDTGPGDFDENDLTLALDGFDTGLKLNGFTDGNTVTLTVSGAPTLNQAAILAALQSDGKLIGTIRKADTDNNVFNSLPANTTTTLAITGDAVVPEPATLAVFAGVFGLGGLAARRRLKAAAV